MISALTCTCLESGKQEHNSPAEEALLVWKGENGGETGGMKGRETLYRKIKISKQRPSGGCIKNGGTKRRLQSYAPVRVERKVRGAPSSLR